MVASSLSASKSVSSSCCSLDSDSEQSGRTSLRSRGTTFCVRDLSGSLPGRMIATGHRSLPSTAPALNRGTSPATTTDDLPLPDGPNTPRNRTPCVARTSPRRALTNQPVRFSRPKKNFASSGRNASKPRYGHTPSYLVRSGSAGFLPVIPQSRPLNARTSSRLSRNSTHDAFMRNSRCATSPHGAALRREAALG